MTSGTRGGVRGDAGEKTGLRIVALLLVLEAVSLYALWTLNPVGPAAESVFAFYLAADLVSFAMVSYVYRVVKRDGVFGKLPLIAGSVLIAAFMCLALVA